MFLHSPSLIHQPFEYLFTFAVLSFVSNGSTLLAMAYFYYSGRVVAPELFVFAKNNVCYINIHCQNDKKFAILRAFSGRILVYPLSTAKRYISERMKSGE